MPVVRCAVKVSPAGPQPSLLMLRHPITGHALGLGDQDIDKNLAKAARKLAAMAESNAATSLWCDQVKTVRRRTVSNFPATHCAARKVS